MTLTVRQQECMVFLETYLKAHGVAPSYDEIGVAIGLIARSAVAKEVIALERAGLIRRIPAYRNAIELLPSKDYHTADCVCVGCVGARYLRLLDLVHALEGTPPVALIPYLHGLRALDNLTRRSWRGGFPHSEARSQPRLKVAQ